MISFDETDTAMQERLQGIRRAVQGHDDPIQPYRVQRDGPALMDPAVLRERTAALADADRRIREFRLEARARGWTDEETEELLETCARISRLDAWR